MAVDFVYGIQVQRNLVGPWTGISTVRRIVEREVCTRCHTDSHRLQAAIGPTERNFVAVLGGLSGFKSLLYGKAGGRGVGMLL